VFPRTFVRLRPRKVSLLDDVGQPRRSHRNSDLLPLEDAIANFDLGLLRLSLGARLLNSAAVTVAIDHEFVVVVFVGASRLAPTNLSITLSQVNCNSVIPFPNCSRSRNQRHRSSWRQDPYRHLEPSTVCALLPQRLRRLGHAGVAHRTGEHRHARRVTPAAVRYPPSQPQSS